MNVPKLRFSEFSENYKKIKLKNMTKLITKGTTPRKYTDSGVNFIKVENLLDNQIKNINSYISYETHNNELKRSILKEYDILFSIAGALGRTAIVTKEELPANTNQACSIIRLDNLNDYNLYYLMERLHHFDIKSYINKCQSVGAQPNLSLEQVGNICINIPNKKEQDRVGRLIELVNKKIELQTKKIDALKLFKKGLFDTQLKINGKESIMFDDFLDEVTEKSSIQNQYPVLSSTSKGLFLQSDYFNKQASSENNVGYKILKRNQLVLSPQNLWMGNININNIFDIGIVSPSYRVYNIDIKKIDLNYFNYWIKTPKALYNYLISSEQGASIVRRNLNIEMFNQISLKIPNLEKQHIIGNMIYQFDLKINLEEEKLKLLYKLKKGLMQKMFI